MAEQVKRSRLKHFLNVTPGSSTPTWALMGDGITEQTVNMNPETQTEQYIHQDSASSFLKSYGPAIDGQQTAKKGDDVYDFIDTLGWDQAIADDAKTEIIEVRQYLTTSGTSFKAKKWDCNIAVNEYGGAGADPLSHSFSVNIEGDPVFGTFDIDTLAFTPTP